MSVKPINNLTFNILKPLVLPISFFRWQYRRKSKYRIKKGESVIVISNHQTDLDPLLIQLSFNKLLRTLSTDNIFKKGRMGRFLLRMGGIPKRKGMMDMKSNLEMFRLVNEGKSLLFFPEGNRSYAEFQYYITEGIGKLIKKLKSTLIIFNIHGGTGRYPRFASKPRKGKFYGEIKKAMPYEEYSDMSDEELTKLIIDNLRVFDSESGELYKSKERAEYLERMFFVCPKCGTPHKLVSDKNIIRCEHCGLEVTYNENLTLSSDDPDFKFTRLVEWYNYQKKWVRDYKVKKGEGIFKDSDITLRTCNPYERSELLSEGNITLNDEKLIFDKIIFDLKDITIASPVSGRKFIFSIGDKQYEVRGDKRFNPLKYVFMFNKLDTKMKETGIDKYYNLEEEKYDLSK